MKGYFKSFPEAGRAVLLPLSTKPCPRVTNDLKPQADGWGRALEESLVHTITLKVFGYHWEGEEQADRKPRRANGTNPATNKG